MRNLVAILFVLIFAISCKNNNGAVPVDFHEITAAEVINTSEYTYVLASESGIDQWLAIPLTQIETGKTYYYQGGMIMENFESRELKRSFDKIVFLEGLSADKNNLSPQTSKPTMGQKSEEKHANVNANLRKMELSIVKAIGGITIAELFANKAKYSGKDVKISGVVCKFSPEIMNKNWIHIQDGTESGGKFDLTITTNETAEVGDTVTFEGEITIDKDFGYGYFYEVLLEDAKKVK